MTGCRAWTASYSGANAGSEVRTRGCRDSRDPASWSLLASESFRSAPEPASPSTLVSQSRPASANAAFSPGVNDISGSAYSPGGIR